MLRLHLIFLDLLTAAVLASAVVLVAPGDLSRTYALIVIATSVVPGLMLTGDVKMISAGIPENVYNLLQKVTVSTLINLPIGVISVFLIVPYPPWALLPVLIFFGAFGATAQTFSSVWYYTQTNTTKMFQNKAASMSVKVIFVGIAIASSELTFALLGNTLGAIVEFGLNFQSLSFRATPAGARRHNLISMLGAAYGVSRVVSATIRIGLEQLFGSLIASLLIVEQLVGGINSVFEKYFLRSSSLQSIQRYSRIVKIFYILAMIFLVEWLVAYPPDPSSRLSLVWLLLVALAGLLPLTEMYVTLQRRGQTYVALGSIGISVLHGVGFALAVLQGYAASAALIAYVAYPSLAFIFYWTSNIYVNHNPKP